MPMKVMCDNISNNDCGSSMCSAIGMCVVCCVFMNFDVTLGEMRFRNQCLGFLILNVSFLQHAGLAHEHSITLFLVV